MAFVRLAAATLLAGAAAAAFAPPTQLAKLSLPLRSAGNLGSTNLNLRGGAAGPVELAAEEVVLAGRVRTQAHAINRAKFRSIAVVLALPESRTL